MIPKKIHYCWFGANNIPESLNKYIDNWKNLCQDYEIILWNEDKFDVSSIPFVKTAYEEKEFQK